MRKLKIALGVVVALALVVRLGLLTARPVPERARFALDLASLREAAGPQEGGPESPRAEQVASLDAPEALVVTGGSFQMLHFGMYAWQLPYLDGGSVVIDPVHSRRTHDEEQGGSGEYFEEAWARQETAMAQASAIVVTHEHYDHLGGVADSAHFERFGDRLKLNAVQRQRPPISGVSRDLAGPATVGWGQEGSVHPVAPGVAAITAAGHTPGSQMIYVRLRTGPEYLFVGDIAWQDANLERLQPRARVVSWIMREDSEAITHQLRAIADFKRANPSVDVVVAHDRPAMERRFAAGTVKRGL